MIRAGELVWRRAVPVGRGGRGRGDNGGSVPALAGTWELPG